MTRVALIAMLALLCAGMPARADEGTTTCAGHPDALGTSRVAIIGTRDAPRLGLKTYARTLQLADHEVVLTFDDGPSRTTTPKVLAALAAECVHATFFLIGQNAAAAPGLVKAELNAGDTVGHHTFSHPAITERGLSTDAAEADINKGFRADDVAGYGTASDQPHVPFFRFPGFADTAELDQWLAERHVAIFGADLWASDWNKMTPEQELTLLLGRLETAGRGIILLHDTKPQTAAMMPAFLRALKDRHFRIVHMVPGDGETSVAPAPAGWHSETETTITALWPKLIKMGARNPMPAGGTN